MTDILHYNEIKKIIPLNKSLIPIIEEGFINLSKNKTVTPPIMRLDIEEFYGEADVKAAYIKGLDSFAIKIAVGYFNNPSKGLPSSGGLMVLLNSETGVIKAILLDQGYLTDVRTAIAGAIASKYLSNLDIENVGIIGSGMQAQLQLESLMMVRNPKTVYVWARDQAKADKYIKTMKMKINVNFINSKNIQELCKNCQILITTTPSDKPLIKNDWVKKGTHITAMGSDAEHKNEIDPLIIRNCDSYVPDKQSQTIILGELHHAIKNGLINKDKKFNELGEIINNPTLGRKSNDDITICDLTGTGVQDTAIARHTYNLFISNKI
ncbi:MAG: cyclodeaminase [Pelagibacteraceae bacterium]|nr:cyclodeaminase [Pelagibacteraceae bacterium]|tara:strand:- start:9851 stop:10819 length:969 start_codon:yes stop_codon:yes gene_type:complete